jgi:dolichol-phosphate mannosyltransferase
MTTIVVIPTYNEAQNIPAISAELMTLEVADLQILIVDDNSPDGTGQLAEEIGKCYPGGFTCSIGRANRGWARPILPVQVGAGSRADYVVQMDADFSHSPNYIPQMLAQIEAYDVVVGSRYVGGGELDERWSWWRWFLSWWANSVWTRGILGVKTKDATAGFKMLAAQRSGTHRAG